MVRGRVPRPLRLLQWLHLQAPPHWPRPDPLVVPTNKPRSWYGASCEGAAIYDAQATAKVTMANVFAGSDYAVDGLVDEAMANAATFNTSAGGGSPC